MKYKLLTCLFFMLPFSVLAQNDTSAPAASLKTFDMVKLENVAVIDGVLDDDVWQQARLFLNTGSHRKLSANLSVWAGEFYDGDHVEFRSAITWRPNN